MLADSLPCCAFPHCLYSRAQESVGKEQAMRCYRLLGLLLLMVTTMVSAQTGSTSGSGAPKATVRTPTRAAVPRNRLADERGNASGAIGGSKLTPTQSK